MTLVPGTPVTVTLSSQEAPEEEKVRYTLPAMTSAERLRYEERRAAIYDLPTFPDQNARLNELLLATLTAWDNIMGGDGQPVPLNDEGLNQLRFGDKLLIAAELPSAAEWSAREKKS